MSDLHVTDPEGRQAMLEDRASGRSILRLEDGQRIDLPADLLTTEPDGSLRSSVPFDRLIAEDGGAEGDVFLEVEERLHVGKKETETGRVRITRRVETREEVIDEPGWRERVDVERVPVGEYVDEVVPIREEGDVTVVPVYEEVLVVERRLRLKEEVHLRKTREETSEPQRHTVRRTIIDIERMAEGREASKR